MVVFLSLRTYERLPPRGMSPKATEGERVTIKSAQIASHAGSFHHFVVPLPPGGRLLCAVSLRIVGSGFCRCQKAVNLVPPRAGLLFAFCV